jgi:uncharacterized protein
MAALKGLAWFIVIAYAIIVILLYTLQRRLIFYPGILSADYKFETGDNCEEIILTTNDGESISGLFYTGELPDVIVYFHGNAGDLSGWQYVSEDFTSLGFNFLIIDYRGYGKSTGKITEKGLYRDADAAYQYLLDRGFQADNIIIYGRSIGSGIAVELAARRTAKGLILESPFSSFAALANEKFPLFLPSFYLRFRFDNLRKINKVSYPIIFLHGTDDELIPASHSRKLFGTFKGNKKMILVDRGAHNDLHAFAQYKDFLRDVLPHFFER